MAIGNFAVGADVNDFGRGELRESLNYSGYLVSAMANLKAGDYIWDSQEFAPPEGYILALFCLGDSLCPMPFSGPEPGRQRLPHLVPLEFANQTTVIFLTMSVAKRRPLLARPEIVALLLDCWNQAGHWRVGRWVVMPDHLHLFCAPTTQPATSLQAWVRYWRKQATRRWPHQDETPIWQREFFDRRLRSGESYHQKWFYLWENPIKAGIVKRPEDWAFQGEMHVLEWHEPA